jgi:hypothetical protein
VLWDASTGTPHDLHPTHIGGIVFSAASGSDGAQQAGDASGSATGYETHAMLWNGSAGSVVDLHPVDLRPAGLAKWPYSFATGAGGGQQVGFAGNGDIAHAMLWKGTAASAIDLNPGGLGIHDSHAVATDGIHQVGAGNRQGGPELALLWDGDADSAVSLNPTRLPGFDSSAAYGVSGNQQVGEALDSVNFRDHAMLWTGSAASAVDLHPVGYNTSLAQATNGVRQVGQGDHSHALLWSGTADSVVDLHALLPDGWSYSNATAIDAQGNAFGVARDPARNDHAVMWTPLVPEPASIVVLIASTGLLGRRRRPCDSKEARRAGERRPA